MPNLCVRVARLWSAQSLTAMTVATGSVRRERECTIQSKSSSTPAKIWQPFWASSPRHWLATPAQAVCLLASRTLKALGFSQRTKSRLTSESVSGLTLRRSFGRCGPEEQVDVTRECPNVLLLQDNARVIALDISGDTCVELSPIYQFWVILTSECPNDKET